MLVLTRKLQEAIKIGDGVTVTILKVKGNTVRLGIEAPRSVRVIRAELPPNETPAATQEGVMPAPAEAVADEEPAVLPIEEAVTAQRRAPAIPVRARRGRLPMPATAISTATAK